MKPFNWQKFWRAFIVTVTIGAAVVLSFRCRSAIRPPTTQPTTRPVMPSMAAAKAAVPDAETSTLTVKPDLRGWIRLDLYTLPGEPGVVYVALLGKDGLTLALDVTAALYAVPGEIRHLRYDPANPKATVYLLTPGDTDLDGDVDLVDLGTLTANYNTTHDLMDPDTDPWSRGDFDLDGDVDLVDLGTLAHNYTEDTDRVLLDAIREVESGGDDYAVGDFGKSLGAYQIGKLYWQDACEYGRVDWDYRTFVWSRLHAEQVMRWYWQRYDARTDRQKAAFHIAGPRGAQKLKTNKNVQRYVRQVIARLGQ